MTRHQFVALEGVPGVGKTTLARTLAADLGSTTHSLPESFRRLRAEIDLDRTAQPLVRLQYYLAATAHLASEIEAALERAPVISDRYLASVLGLLQADGDLSAATIDDLSAPLRRRLPIPDMTLVLTATPGVLRERIGAREPKAALHRSAVHSRAEHDEAFLQRWQDGIIGWSADLGPHRVLDTSGLSPSATSRVAMASLATRRIT